MMIRENVRLKTDVPGTIMVFLIVVASVIFVVSGCSKQQGGGKFSMPPMSVEIALAKVQIVTDKFESVGNVEAMEAITVVSEIDAAVVSLPFQEGSAIQRGELIARLDDSQLAAERSRTEALREQSQANYNRVKAVVEQNAASPQNLDDAAAALKVADANLALAKARFAKTRIVAPFSGIAGARRVSVGTFLRIGNVITNLANIHELRVNFSAPERFLSQLSQGAEVTVSTSAYPDHQVKGNIIAIEPMVDPGTRSARVVARVPNPGQKFRPGMSANISAVLSERPNAITIPSEAVFASGNQSFVFVVKPDSTVARVAVTLGTRLVDIVEVLQGLTSGTPVVRAGHQKIFDGAKVIPVTSQPVATTQ